MLVFDFHEIGNKLLMLRKSLGLTQSEVAEKAGLADRTYADIERGSVSMRVDTLLKICEAFSVTPDSILTQKDTAELALEELLFLLNNCTEKEKQTALQLLSVYLKSIE